MKLSTGAHPVSDRRAAIADRYVALWPALAAVAVLCFLLDLSGVESRTLLAGDRTLDLGIHHDLGPSTYGLFRALTTLGDGTARIVIVGIGVVVAWLRRRLWIAVLLIAGVGGADLLGTVIKAVVARPRPHLFPHAVAAGGASFPSGHTTGTWALCLLLMYLLLRWRRASLSAVLLSLVALAFAVLVGLSRLVLGVHYPTDVLGGVALALAWDALVIWGIEWHTGRNITRQVAWPFTPGRAK